MKMSDENLSKKDKVLITLLRMSRGKQSTLKYEDIIVNLFNRYPQDFHLRGYPEYPDTSNQAFYSLRKDGLIQVRNKFVSLTEKGIITAKQIIRGKSKVPQKSSQKLSRDIMSEVDRIKNTDTFQLFVADKKEQIVDTDFFSYLGTTVRTERTDFKARINTIEGVIKTIKSNTEHKTIVDLHNYLFERFKDIIKTKLSIGVPRRKHE